MDINKQFMHEMAERKQAEEALQKAYKDLERRLAEQSAALAEARTRLEQEHIKRKQAEERFYHAVEAMPTAIMMVDAEGTIVLVNTMAERLFGYRRDALVGSPIDRLLPQRHRAMHLSHRARFFARPEARTMGVGRDLFALHKDGHEFPVEVGLSPIQMNDQALVLSAVVDITTRKRAERAFAEHAEALAQSNEELEQFAYVASHDLQQPLQTIGGFATLLSRRYKGRLDADADEFIGYITEGVQWMQTLIRDLLAFSRLDRDASNHGPVDLNTLLEQLLHAMQASLAEAEITYDRLPVVEANDAQLKHLFQNLISNAVKFRRDEKPRVHITAEGHDGLWRISVQDNGIGIDQASHDHIFMMFKRLHTRQEYEGTGIGLALCKKIVEHHGGRIWLTSEVGRGTTFYFTLPQTHPVAEAW